MKHSIVGRVPSPFPRRPENLTQTPRVARLNSASGALLAEALVVVSLGLPACAKRASDRTASATSTRKGLADAAQSGDAERLVTGSALGSGDLGSSLRIRPAQKAGRWYPEDRAWAAAEMHRMFRAAGAAPRLPAKPLALVVPHAGWSYSGAAAAAAYGQLGHGDFGRVVLLGPSHQGGFEGFALSEYDAYETPLGRVPLCLEASELRDGDLIRDVPEADRGEHSLELQLPWLQEALGSFCIVPILVGTTDAKSEGRLAAKLAKLKDGKTLFVVSSDFVHYGPRFDYTPFGDSASAARDRVFELENQAIGFLSRKDAAGLRQLVSTTRATICGYRGQLVLLELLARVAPQAQAVTLAHYSSADLAGERDDSGSVGYVSLGYVEGAVVPSRPMNAPAPAPPCSAQAEVPETVGRALLGLARSTLSTKLRGTDDLDRALAALPKAAGLDCRQAVFVTLKAHGQLRGCVGQVEPEYPLVEAVVRSALDSALKDRRFDPVSSGELAELSFELTVLTVPSQVLSYRDIVLGKHGIILSSQGRRSLFLPQVPGEQGWDLPQTLRALSKKAGLDEDAWAEAGARFSVFTGSVFEESSEPGRPERVRVGGDGGTLQ